MQTITVTIGRNIQGTSTPMRKFSWESFQHDVTEVMLINLSAAETHETHIGVGSFQGIEEESWKITFFLFTPIDTLSLDLLRQALAVLRNNYAQDAIALTLGESELI